MSTNPAERSGHRRPVATRRTGRSAAITLFAVAALGTTCRTYPVDPAVDYQDQPSYEPIGTPILEIGFYVEQLYRPLRTGDPLPIINGLQGGRWTMPALRVRGLSSPAQVHCILLSERDDGESQAVGEVIGTTRLVLAIDGWLENQAYPVPIRPPSGSSVVDLYGMPTTLTCTIEDEGERAAQASLDVVFAEG